MSVSETYYLELESPVVHLSVTFTATLVGCHCRQVDICEGVESCSGIASPVV